MFIAPMLQEMTVYDLLPEMKRKERKIMNNVSNQILCDNYKYLFMQISAFAVKHNSLRHGF